MNKYNELLTAPLTFRRDKIKTTIMKKLVFILLLFIPFLAFTQSNQKVLNAQGKIVGTDLANTKAALEQHGSAAKRADISKDVAKFAPGWKVKDCGDDESPGLKSSYAGRKNVLVTHPLSTLTPCVLTKEVYVPEGKTTTLQLSVLHTSPDKPNSWYQNIYWIDIIDWLLVVKVDGREVFLKMVNNALCKGGWADLNVDLTPYAGERIEVALEHHANNWAWESGFWSQIAIKSQ